MDALTYRRLDAADLDRLADIDRTEHVPAYYVQRGEELVEVVEPYDMPPWFPAGDDVHSLPHQIAFCARQLAAGGVALGAFDGPRLVGVGVVTPHARPGIAQLAYLYVGDGYRGRGVGARLCDQMEAIARAAGDESMVVSASPAVNTVRFYMARGFRPTADPWPELVAAAPEDVQLSKRL